VWSQHLACKAAALQRYVEDEGPGSSRDDLEPAWLWGKIMGDMGEKTCSWGYGCSFFPQISMYNIYIYLSKCWYIIGFYPSQMSFFQYVSDFSTKNTWGLKQD
jgi:hypothetical protein